MMRGNRVDRFVQHYEYLVAHTAFNCDHLFDNVCEDCITPTIEELFEPLAGAGLPRPRRLDRKGEGFT